MKNVLLKPWSYLTIQPIKKQKILIDWLLPAILAVATVYLIFQLFPLTSIIGVDKLIDKLTSFIQTLPGFYLAALSAIATFNNPGMDNYLQGEKLTISILLNGRKQKIQLTRRRFLTTMFAFLTANAVVVAIFGVVMAQLESVPICHIGFVALLTIYFIFFWQLITVTLWGLYYLGERIHTPNE